MSSRSAPSLICPIPPPENFQQEPTVCSSKPLASCLVTPKLLTRDAMIRRPDHLLPGHDALRRCNFDFAARIPFRLSSCKFEPTANSNKRTPEVFLSSVMGDNIALSTDVPLKLCSFPPGVCGSIPPTRSQGTLLCLYAAISVDSEVKCCLVEISGERSGDPKDACMIGGLGSTNFDLSVVTLPLFSSHLSDLRSVNSTYLNSKREVWSLDEEFDGLRRRYFRLQQ